MSADTGDEYRSSYFDKHGPEAASHWTIASFLLIPTVGGALVGTTYFAHQGYSAGGVLASALVDTYPETEVAERARAGLVNLKSQLGATE